tara:strand:- start:5855 stop:5962 length:108 start_codon:yes stop_codon:yes gene_type:complete
MTESPYLIDKELLSTFKKESFTGLTNKYKSIKIKI